VIVRRQAALDGAGGCSSSCLLSPNLCQLRNCLDPRAELPSPIREGY